MYVIGLLIIMECLGKYLVRDYQNIVLKNFDSAFFAQHNQLLCHFFHPNKRGGHKISPTQDTRTHVHMSQDFSYDSWPHKNLFNHRTLRNKSNAQHFVGGPEAGILTAKCTRFFIQTNEHNMAKQWCQNIYPKTRHANRTHSQTGQLQTDHSIFMLICSSILDPHDIWHPDLERNQ